MPTSAAPSPAFAASRAEVCGDIFYGAGEIAAFLFGNARYRRRVYTRVATGKLPVFIGANICARRSVLLEWMAEQERKR
jgi:hypothetical protein